MTPCPKCNGKLFDEYGDTICICGFRRDRDYGQELKNITTYSSDTGCEKAVENGYEGQCIDCPFPVCFEDLTREGTPRPVKKGDKRSMNPGRPSVNKV